MKMVNFLRAITQISFLKLAFRKIFSFGSFLFWKICHNRQKTDSCLKATLYGNKYRDGGIAMLIHRRTKAANRAASLLLLSDQRAFRDHCWPRRPECEEHYKSIIRMYVFIQQTEADVKSRLGVAAAQKLHADLAQRESFEAYAFAVLQQGSEPLLLTPPQLLWRTSDGSYGLPLINAVWLAWESHFALKS